MVKFGDLETEYMVKQILKYLGSEIDIKANKKSWEDSYTYLYGDIESYTVVKGLEYRFDDFYLRGYNYMNNYYFSIIYGHDNYYYKKEDGTIDQSKENIWKIILMEIYNSIDVLVKNQQEKERFFANYGRYIPWPKKMSLASCEETRKNYIKELNITLIVEVYFNWITPEISEEKKKYQIYFGSICVYDSVKNIFIDGPWKDKLIKYIIEQQQAIAKEKQLIRKK